MKDLHRVVNNKIGEPKLIKITDQCSLSYLMEKVSEKYMHVMNKYDTYHINARTNEIPTNTDVTSHGLSFMVLLCIARACPYCTPLSVLNYTS